MAKEVTIKSVKVCDAGGFCDPTNVAAGVDWVVRDHLLNPSAPAVLNMSLGYPPGYPNREIVDTHVLGANSNVITCAVAAGNSNVDASTFVPAHLRDVLTTAASDINDNKAIYCCGQASNYGSIISVIAPGDGLTAASYASDTGSAGFGGTSGASPHVAGAAALYLQGRTGASQSDCFSINSPVPSNLPPGYDFSKISTCPDRSRQLIKSNTSLGKISNFSLNTPNRLLYTGSLPATTNPVDNQRFFVWQQYGDFLVNQPEPDENGLDFWTGQITNTCGTGFDFNANNSCVHTKRIDVSRAFFVAAYPSLFTYDDTQYHNVTGLTNNNQFVHTVYQVYLRRSVSDGDGGFQFWLGQLNNYGTPANPAGINFIIDAFTISSEFRERFGQP